MTERVHGVVLVGDGNAATELLAAGINDFVIFDHEVTRAVFDDASDTWTLTADDSEFCCGRIVISCESPFVPWIPDLFGRRDFRGPAIHASMPETDFDRAGRRVAGGRAGGRARGRAGNRVARRIGAGRLAYAAIQRIAGRADLRQRGTRRTRRQTGGERQDFQFIAH